MLISVMARHPSSKDSVLSSLRMVFGCSPHPSITVLSSELAAT